MDFSMGTRHLTHFFMREEQPEEYTDTTRNGRMCGESVIMLEEVYQLRKKRGDGHGRRGGRGHGRRGETHCHRLSCGDKVGKGRWHSPQSTPGTPQSAEHKESSKSITHTFLIGLFTPPAQVELPLLLTLAQSNEVMQ